MRRIAVSIGLLCIAVCTAIFFHSIQKGSSPCPVPTISRDGWQPVAIPYGPFTIHAPRVPELSNSDSNSVEGMDWEHFTQRQSETFLEVATPPAEMLQQSGSVHHTPLVLFEFGGHTVDDIDLVPRRVATLGAHTSEMTVAGRPMAIRWYKTKKYYRGPFVADVVWPLQPGSWLVFGISAPTKERRDTMLAMLQSLQVDSTPQTQALVHPRDTCPAWPAIHNDLPSRTLHVGALAFDVPNTFRDESQGYLVFTAAWNSTDEASFLRFTLKRAAGWQLPVHGKLPSDIDGKYAWCTTTIAGRHAEFLVDTMGTGQPGNHDVSYQFQGFAQMTPDSIVEISGSAFVRPNGQRPLLEFADVMHVLRSAH